MGIGIKSIYKGAKYLQPYQPTAAAYGEIWYNTLNGECKIWSPNNSWVNLFTESVVVEIGDIGVFGGGFTGYHKNTIEYITISTPGNATDFGDLTSARTFLGGSSNGNDDRGVFGGGTTGSGSYVNTIDYITISTPGNATDFGDLTVIRGGTGACSNGTNDRGVCGGGTTGSYVNTIDYITISSTGNATDFGDLTVSGSYIGSCSNGINNRGVFGSRYYSSDVNVIDYITISSTGNASDFGDLTTVRSFVSSCSNDTEDRGVFGGGNFVNIIDYVTISSTSNASDFGDLTIAVSNRSGLGNGINDRGVFGGGNTPGPTPHNVIDYITISSTGNASDFGDLTESKYGSGTCSNSAE